MMKKVVEGIKRSFKYGTCSNARILTACDNFSVVSEWTQPDVERAENSTFGRTHIVSSDFKRVIYAGGPTLRSASEKMTSWSPTGKLCAIVSSSTKANKEEQFFVEIWNKSRRIHQWNTSAKDVHGPVYFDGQFGCLSWSPDETKIAYVAEKNRPKIKSLFAQQPPLKDDKPEEEPSLNEEYAYKEEWGEQLVGKHHSVVCVLTIESGDIKVLEQVPEGYSCGQVVFLDNNSVVGVAWDENPYRLGLVFCFNRNSSIFIASLDGKYEVVSEEQRSVASPRVSPDSRHLIYLDKMEGGPHMGTVRLLLYHIVKKQTTVLVDVVEELKDDSGFAGLYLLKLPNRCWNNNNSVLLSSIRSNQLVSYIVCYDGESTEAAKLYELTYAMNTQVLDVDNGHVVMSATDIKSPEHIVVAKLPDCPNEDECANLGWTALDEIESVPWLANVSVSRMKHTSETGLVYNSVVSVPCSEDDDVPWILIPHGGPHSAYVSRFSSVLAFFLHMGFGIVSVNFIGSLGLGQKCVDALPGNIGRTDVKDVYDAGVEACKQHPKLSASKKFLYGGSHGGFLVAHLIAQYPSEYRACAMLNPVTDLVTMKGVSDIPDWIYVETGIEFNAAKLSNISDMGKMWECSPQRLVDAVRTPTLLVIGSEDRRVPPSQGLAFYKMLKARGVEVSLRLYPDCHSLAKMSVLPDVEAGVIMWFLDHL